MKNSGAIKPPLSKAAAALLHACKKAAADFEKGGFISLSSQNNREVTKMKPLFHKKPRSMPGFIVRVPGFILVVLLPPHSRLEPKRIFCPKSCARA